MAIAATQLRSVMEPDQILTVDSFRKLPRECFEFNRWAIDEGVLTSFGSFQVEAVTPLGDDAPPDGRMIDQANRLVGFVQRNEGAILDKIFEHYQLLVRDESWMESCDVPTNLGRTELSPYLVGLDITVDREEDEPILFVTPQWDEEHGIYLTVQGDAIEFTDRWP